MWYRFQEKPSYYEFHFLRNSTGKPFWMTAGGVSNKYRHDGTSKLTCHFARCDSEAWHIIKALRKTHEGWSRITETKADSLLQYIPTLQLAPVLLNKHKDGRVHSYRAACILCNKSNCIPLEVTILENHRDPMGAAGNENSTPISGFSQ